MNYRLCVFCTDVVLLKYFCTIKKKKTNKRTMMQREKQKGLPPVLCSFELIRVLSQKPRFGQLWVAVGAIFGDTA